MTNAKIKSSTVSNIRPVAERRAPIIDVRDAIARHRTAYRRWKRTWALERAAGKELNVQRVAHADFNAATFALADYVPRSVDEVALQAKELFRLEKAEIISDRAMMRFLKSLTRAA